jgi:hypothetical protein
MHHVKLEGDAKVARKLYLGIFYFCAAVMATITIYAICVSVNEYLHTGKVVIGEILVDTEFPVKGLSKLVTYLMIVSVVGWYCVTKLGANKVRGISDFTKSILQVVVLGIAIIAFYEFIYNFILWNSFITVDIMKGVMKLDSINVPYPNPKTPWNLVFATKMSLAAFLISAHGFYLMSKKPRIDMAAIRDPV